MLALSSASAEMCDLLNPIACGLYDCGGSSWSLDDTQGKGDNLSLRSGVVNMIGSSRVCMNVTGPGLIKFVWKVDPLAQHVGTLDFWADNSQVAVCKSQEWIPVSYILREKRDYNLAWQFYKYKSIPAGMGGGWIDDLAVIGENLMTMPKITSQISSDYPEINISSANLANKTASNLGNCTPLNRSCCSCEAERNEISPCDENAKYNAIEGPIIIPPPNITIDITLDPKVNISVNIIQSDDMSADLPINKPQLPMPRCNKIIVGSCNCTSFKNASRYLRIQDAILNSKDGDEIYICNGTYNEVLTIDRSLNIYGESRSGTRIESNNEINVTIIKVCHENVALEHMSIINLGHHDALAIGAKSSDNITIRDCEIRNCSNGIEINNSKNAYITNNNISIYENCNNTSTNTNSKKIIGIQLKGKYRGALINDNIINVGGNGSIVSYGIAYVSNIDKIDPFGSNCDRKNDYIRGCNNTIYGSKCQIASFRTNNEELECKKH